MLPAAVLLVLHAAPVVVFPPVTEAKDASVALVIQDRASALIARSGAYHLMHVKQVISMSSRHAVPLDTLADPVAARTGAERLGTQRFVYGRLKRGRGGWKLSVTAAEVGSAKTLPLEKDLPEGTAAMVREASETIARALLTLDGSQLPLPPPTVQPDTASDPAMNAYATCFATVIRQPISVEAPSVLREDVLSAAKAACKSAVAADPGFSAAWAALSLAQSLSGDDEAAVSSLARVKPEAGFVPLAWVARFWLVTRYQSSQGGEAVLKRAIEQNPGFLLARGYLAELYNAVGKQTEAAEAWRQYLALSPDNPYILTRMAYTLARLGKAQDAVKFSEQATALDPQSLELKLELASRYVDGMMIEQALSVLEPLSARSDATAEVILRCGYALLVHGDFDKAQATLERAFRGASAPADWRTRARAKYDLALVAYKKGSKDRARTLLLQAVSHGLKPRPSNSDEEELVALAKPEELVPPRKIFVREASPFVVEDGEIVPDANRPTPPKGFDAVKAP